MALGTGAALFATSGLLVDPEVADGLLPSSWVWLTQALVGVYGLGGAWYFRRVMLRKMAAAAPANSDGDDGADQLAALHTTTQLAIATLWSTVPLLATVASLMTGDPAHTVAGLSVAIVSAPLLAPTSRRIEAEERQLQATGVVWSLREVLYDALGAAGPAGPEPA